jgi:hypothetical protein
MRAPIVPPLLVVLAGLALSGCAGSAADATPPPRAGSAPVIHATPRAPARPAVPVAVGEARPAGLTRTDAYELCRAAAADPATADPRDAYAGVDASEVTMVDDRWQVWIPGVTHPDGEPVDVALTCVLDGDAGDPSFSAYGGVASDYHPDHAAYFEELLEPVSE